MVLDFKFPDVGEGIAEGRIVKWHVKIGDEIKADDVLCEIETDKAIVEIPSPRQGKILKTNGKEGEIIKVGDTLVVIGDAAEGVAQVMTAFPDASKKGADVNRVENSSVQIKPVVAKKWSGVVGELEEATEPVKSMPRQEQQKRSTSSNPVRALPSVRKLAVSLGVDITAVKGSGPNATITQEDVVAARQGVLSNSSAAATPPAAQGSAQVQAPKVVKKYDLYGYIEHVPLVGIRKVIAQKMQQAINNAAMVTHMDEVDVTDLWAMREKEKVLAEKKGVKLTLMPFIIKSVVAGLRQFPIMGSYIDEVAQEIIIKKYYNIGIAVDTADGLMVPVIKGVDQKSILEIAHEVQELARKAQDRAVDPGDLKGSSFTITNIGSIGGSHFTPIVNYPEAAILGVGRMQDKAVVIDGSIQVRKMLPLSVTFDHRVLDGAQAARFMNAVKERLEDPDVLLLERD